MFKNQAASVAVFFIKPQNTNQTLCTVEHKLKQYVHFETTYYNVFLHTVVCSSGIRFIVVISLRIKPQLNVFGHIPNLNFQPSLQWVNEDVNVSQLVIASSSEMVACGERE